MSQQQLFALSNVFVHRIQFEIDLCEFSQSKIISANAAVIQIRLSYESYLFLGKGTARAWANWGGWERV